MEQPDGTAPITHAPPKSLPFAFLNMAKPPDISLRRLDSSDLLRLRAMNAVFARAFDDRASYLGNPPGDDYLRSLLAKEHVVVLVASAGDEVVGGLVAYALDKWEQARRELYIYDLAVAAEHRRRGIATALIETLREIGATQGAWVIFVQATMATSRQSGSTRSSGRARTSSTSTSEWISRNSEKNRA